VLWIHALNQRHQQRGDIDGGGVARTHWDVPSIVCLVLLLDTAKEISRNVQIKVEPVVRLKETTKTACKFLDDVSLNFDPFRSLGVTQRVIEKVVGVETGESWMPSSETMDMISQ